MTNWIVTAFFPATLLCFLAPPSAASITTTACKDTGRRENETMALIVDKHRPRSLDTLTYHPELTDRLRALVCTNRDLGPPGSKWLQLTS